MREDDPGAGENRAEDRDRHGLDHLHPHVWVAGGPRQGRVLFLRAPDRRGIEQPLDGPDRARASVEDDAARSVGGRFEDRELVMCSGNLLRLKAWQQANGFRDDFFIDIVDDEICCHLRQLGWQVIRANQIMLTHHLGNGVKYLGPTKHPYTPHPAWRYFYIARNIRRMFPLYPEMKPYYKHQVYKYLKRIFLYDFDHKGDKLKAFYKGWTADRSLCGKVRFKER